MKKKFIEQTNKNSLQEPCNHVIDRNGYPDCDNIESTFTIREAIEQAVEFILVNILIKR